MAETNKKIARNIAPDKLEMLVLIVHKEKIRFYTNLIQTMEANFHLNLPASGTSEKAIVSYIGLNEPNRAAILSVIREDKEKDLLEVLDENFNQIKGGGGIAFTIPLSSLIGSLVYSFLSNDKRTLD